MGMNPKSLYIVITQKELEIASNPFNFRKESPSTFPIRPSVDYMPFQVFLTTPQKGFGIINCINTMGVGYLQLAC